MTTVINFKGPALEEKLEELLSDPATGHQLLESVPGLKAGANTVTVTSGNKTFRVTLTPRGTRKKADRRKRF